VSSSRALLSRRNGRRRAPVRLGEREVHGGLIYLAGSERFGCYDLRSGKVHWEEKARAEITSPILVDGKIVCITGNGGFLNLVEATTQEFRKLSKVRLRATRCPSPAFSDGRLFLKKKDHIAS